MKRSAVSSSGGASRTPILIAMKARPSARAEMSADMASRGFNDRLRMMACAATDGSSRTPPRPVDTIGPDSNLEKCLDLIV